VHECEIIFNTTTRLEPGVIFEQRILTPKSLTSLPFRVEVLSGRKLLIHFTQSLQPARDLPVAASAAPDPHEIGTNEKLYLNGLHLEQYRHATYDPCAYYLEAIRRDPTDIRCNNAMGLWFLRRAQPEKAEPYLRTAVRSLTLRNPNPYDGEPLYNLGLCLKMQNKPAEAFDVLYKSTWNDSCQHNGFLQLARLACASGDFEDALELVNKSINRNYSSPAARHLKTAVLRKLNRDTEAIEWVKASLLADPFNLGCLWESNLLGEPADFSKAVRNSFNNYAEYALDYAHAGLFNEAYELLKIYKPVSQEPLLNYYLGWFKIQLQDPGVANHYFAIAASSPADYCFPSKTEEVTILRDAIKQNERDSKALYYLGNYWYANANYPEAVKCWENSAALNDTFPTVFRNLALVYYNKLSNRKLALEVMDKAFNLDNADARLLMELDLLHKLNNYPAWDRLKLLEKHINLVEQRNDLYMERLTLYNQLGDFETAQALISERNFQPWEGGEGKIVLQYSICHIELAKQALEQNDPHTALQLLQALVKYPNNLGEGKLPGKPENDLYYWMGVAYEMLNEATEANQNFDKAKQGDTIPAQAIFYNDPQPENIFYQGKAWQKTGDPEYARQLFNNLVTFGKQHMHDKIRIDYFAVSLPELMVFDQDLDQKNHVHCLYIMGLGLLGLDDREAANDCFKSVLEKDVNHTGAMLHLNSAIL
jgi:hypothetical protein